MWRIAAGDDVDAADEVHTKVRHKSYTCLRWWTQSSRTPYSVIGSGGDPQASSQEGAAKEGGMGGAELWPQDDNDSS
jgi:hypothetical protein